MLKKPAPLNSTQEKMSEWLLPCLLAEFGRENWFSIDQAAGRLRAAGFCTRNESFTNFRRNIATLLRLDLTGQVEDNEGSGSRKLYRIYAWLDQ